MHAILSVIVALVRSTLFDCANPVLSQVARESRWRKESCLEYGKTTPPAVTRDLPITLRTKSRLTVSPRSGSSVHFASNSSSRPPASATKSTSRVLVTPKEEAGRSASAPFAVSKLGENKCFPYCSHGRGLPKRLNGANVQKSAKQTCVCDVEFGAFDDRLRSIREPRFKQYGLAGGFQHGQPLIRRRWCNTDVPCQVRFVQQVCRTIAS
jgi:hypothetical protein